MSGQRVGQYNRLPSDGGAVRKGHKSAQTHPRYTWCLLGVTAAVVLGSSAQFGFGSGVINNPRLVIMSALSSVNNSHKSCSDSFKEKEANKDDKQLYDVTVSIFSVGGLLGSLVSAALADSIGRKWTLTLNNLVAIVAAILMGLSPNYTILIIGRLLHGINCGINTAVVPLYLSEIAPVDLRGEIGTISQLSITFFIFLSTLLGLPQILGNCAHWHLLLGFPVVFAVQLFILPFCPRSPQFLFLHKEDDEEALKALKRLRAHSDLQHEIANLQLERSRRMSEKPFKILSLFTDRYLRRPLLISIVVQLVQQLTGIGGVFYFSHLIFNSAGVKDSAVAAIAPVAALAVMTILAVKMMDRYGRRTLLLYGLALMFIFELVMTIGFCFQDGFHLSKSPGITWPGILTIAGAIGMVIGFSLGPGPVAWLIVAELFPQNSRAAAVGFATLINWTANAAVGQSFRPIFEYAKPYGLLVFAFFCAILYAFAYCYVPETKERSIEEITTYFHRLADRNVPQNSSLHLVNSRVEHRSASISSSRSSRT